MKSGELEKRTERRVCFWNQLFKTFLNFLANTIKTRRFKILSRLTFSFDFTCVKFYFTGRSPKGTRRGYWEGRQRSDSKVWAPIGQSHKSPEWAMQASSPRNGIILEDFRDLTAVMRLGNSCRWCARRGWITMCWVGSQEEGLCDSYRGYGRSHFRLKHSHSPFDFQRGQESSNQGNLKCNSKQIIYSRSTRWIEFWRALTSPWNSSLTCKKMT
jgi:hypothetical protein